MNVTVENPWLGTQITFWKGQKKSEEFVSPNGVIYPRFRHLNLHKFRPFSMHRVWTHKTRFGLGMFGRVVAASTVQILTKKYINSITAPPRKSWLKKIRESFIRCLLNNINISTSRGTRYYEFYKAQSLKKLRKQQNEIESDY